MLAAALATGPRAAYAAEQELLLDVQVNGYSIGKIGDFTERDGKLFAQANELRDLGFKVPEAIGLSIDGLVDLADLPGLTWRIDRPTQTLYVTATDQSLLPSLLQVEGESDNAGTVESGTGATFNYDVTGTSTDGQKIVNGVFDLRAFSPWGVASTGTLVYAGGGPAGPGTTSAVRLDSTYTYSDPDALHRYRAGDFITGGLSWTRPIRIGGLQFSSDYSLRPDLVTFPLPTLNGSAAVPSTLDVLVNGDRLLSRQLQPGPFSIPQLPTVTGAGTISLAVTNSLGQQVITSLPFYASSALLAPGLQTFSLQVGALRRNFGVISNDYGNLAASGTYRRGVFDWLTVESSVEGTAGAYMGGAGLVTNVANLAVVNASAAASTSAEGTGTQLSVGLQRNGRVFSFGASAIMADRNYRDIAAASGAPAPRLQINASASVSLRRFGSASIAYAGIDRYALPNPVRVFLPAGTALTETTESTGQFVLFQPVQRAHIVSASYSLEIGDLSLYATAFRDLSNKSSNGVLVGLTLPLGSRTSASANSTTGNGGSTTQLQMEQSAVINGDWGYQVLGSTGVSKHEFAQAQYKTSAALLTAGVDHTSGETTVRLESQGAFSYVDGGLFASTAINDSFAVVDTNGLPNIRVQDENRDVGVTDSRGLLLVPDMGSFTVNHIGIVPTDVGLDSALDTATKEVRPQARSGVIVKFPVRIRHGALLQLVDEPGAPIPLGSTATPQRPSATVVPVGYDGEAYLEDLEPHNQVVVDRPNGRRCKVAFDYTPVPGDLPLIGPLTCRETSP